ncbi:MAG TPA: peptidylprolyl isomerase [Bryobacteraceae bacterium]|nr:peptidylprolyl isomerase [Bryobacteraceae bacterium]
MSIRISLLLIAAIPVAFGQTTAMPKVPGAPQAAPKAASAEPNKVVLTVGSFKMTEAQFDVLVDALPAQYQSYARGPNKRQFVESLVQLKLLSGEAEKRGLEKQPKVQEQIQFQRENLLAQAMFESLQETVKVDDAAVKAYYAAHINEYESVKARHILIRVKGAPMPGAEGKPELDDAQALAKAEEIRKKLVSGGDFAAIAKAESDDTGSGAQGGDLGEFRHGMMVPPFEEAAFKQKVGDVGEPVKSPFGYHIIKVEEHKSKTLDEVRGDIEKAMRPEMAKKAVDAMRKDATVTIDDGFFGPATAAPPAATPPAQ